MCDLATLAPFSWKRAGCGVFAFWFLVLTHSNSALTHQNGRGGAVACTSLVSPDILVRHQALGLTRREQSARLCRRRSAAELHENCPGRAGADRPRPLCRNRPHRPAL